MGTAELKTKVHQMIELLDDPFLLVVHSMLDTYVQQHTSIIGYDNYGKPVYAEWAQEEYAKRVLAMKNDEKTSIEDFMKEAAEW